MKNLLLDIQNASFSISKNDAPILDTINYKIYEEDFVIILGSNGSGKSTLLKLIDKRNTISSGNILLKGKDISHYNSKQTSQKIKTLSQNCNDSLFPSLTVFENYILANQKLTLNPKKERSFLQEYLHPFNPKLSTKLDQVVDNLSGGEKQTLALALTILHPPVLLLLDEHTSALDPKTAELNMQLTKEMITKHKITCLLTTHNLSIAQQYGNRILVIGHGKILDCIEGEKKSGFTDQQMLHMFY